MATNPMHDDPAQDWPKRGKKRSEEKYHHLEQLINQFSPLVEIWRRDKQGISLWQPVQRYSQFENPGETVAFTSVNVRIALEELYQDSDFGAEVWDLDEDEG